MSSSSSKAKSWMCGCCGNGGGVEPGPDAPTHQAVQLQILDRYVSVGCLKFHFTKFYLIYLMNIYP